MATATITVKIHVNKWAYPIVYLSFLLGFKCPKWCFTFTTSRKPNND